MKYWENFDDEEITIKVPSSLDKYESNCRIMSINKSCDIVTFQEECDCSFGVELTKDQAIELLKEAIEWLEER